MRTSILKSIHLYVKNVFLGAWSIMGSCFTAVPYIFRWGELRKEVTEGYPDPISSKTPDDLPPRSRGLLFNDIDRCIGCRSCEKICPSQCIQIETEPGAHESKIWVSLFDIDFSQCIFCGLCVEVCQPGSLSHTRQYEGAAYALSDLNASFGRGDVTPEQREKWAHLRQQLKEGDQAFE